MGRRLGAATAIAAIAMVMLGAAGPALAAEYTVTSTGDAPDKAIGTGGCETATPSECTLRAAIQESNASSGTRDKIVFSPAFEGQISDTIAIGSGFPAITDPVTIDGGTCVTEAGIGGPCAGVSGPTPPEPGLVVDNANGVAIEGLAVTGGLIGVDVIDSSQEFTAKNDWVGIRLDGVAGPDSFGIRLANLQGAGSTIEKNLVDNAHIIGLLIESSNNSVIGNEILGTETGSGIVIQEFGPQAASGNTIGGDTAADENVISGSGENAIEILDTVDTDNHVLRNTGSDNAGLFIDLGGDGPGNQPSGPNAGIQAPMISAATPTAVSGGGALPDATIRVFEKATAQNGEIKAFLGEAQADGSGNWSLTYETPLPLGTEIGVTQTGFEGTSELAQATTANRPPPPGGGSGGGSGGGGAGSTDTTAPQTRISKGPKAKSRSRTASLRFNSSEAGSSFQCKLDRGPFKKCRSPKKLKGLKPGKHVFKVRATDAAGNTDPTPAVKKFTVLK